jgi:hypothetical protein
MVVGQGEQSSGLNLGMLQFQVVCGLLSLTGLYR